MDFAVIKIGGKQHKVAKGDVIEVSRINGKEKKVEFGEVLLTSQDGKVKVGSPLVKGVKVTASVLGERKGKKIRVSKFKSKVRYRKTSGFRPLLTQVEIEKIEF